MLAHCINEGCSAPFRYLREGRLFSLAIERDTQSGDGVLRLNGQVEHFWLCGRCSRTMTLSIDNGRIQVVPRTDIPRASQGLSVDEHGSGRFYVKRPGHPRPAKGKCHPPSAPRRSMR